MNTEARPGEHLSGETFSTLLHGWAAKTPGNEYLQIGGDWLTYAEVAERTDRVSAGLQELGLRKGDHLAFLLTNRIEFALTYFACSRIGVVMVPLVPYLRGSFLRHQLVDSDAAALLTDAQGIAQIEGLEPPTLRDIIVVGDVDVEALPSSGGFRFAPFATVASSTRALEVPDVAASDVAAILYSSGTTGMPKGCVVSYEYCVNVAQAVVDSGLFAEGDRLYTSWPMFHTGGFTYGLGIPLIVGGSVSLDEQFSASSFMSRAQEVGATVLFGFGAMAIALLAQPERPCDREHSVRVGFFMPLKPDVQAAFEARFGYPILSECYGQTECVPVTLSNVRGLRKRDSAGKPLPQFEIMIAGDNDRELPAGEVGEILVRPRRSGVMFDGYWKNAEATLDAWRTLWHHTGDFGRLDGDGFLYFVDRKKDALRRRGEFVSSLELEQAIIRHPEVEVVSVHAVPSEMSEDDIKAWIIPVEGRTLEPAAFFDFCRQELPYFAIPRYIEVVDSLPMNSSQRVLKHELKFRENTAATWDFEAMGLVVRRDERRA